MHLSWLIVEERKIRAEENLRSFRCKNHPCLTSSPAAQILKSIQLQAKLLEINSTIHLTSVCSKLNICFFFLFTPSKTKCSQWVQRLVSYSRWWIGQCWDYFFLWKTLASMAPEVVSWPILLRNLVLASSPTKLDAIDMELCKKKKKKKDNVRRWTWRSSEL